MSKVAMMTFVEMVLTVLALIQTPKPEENGRPVLKYDDYKIIAEKNMFSPYKTKKEEKKVEKKVEPKKEDAKQPDPPKPTLVRGLVEMNGAYCVLIEDTATKKAQYYKAGDSVAGGIIEKVDKLKVTIKFGEEKKEFLNGEPLPLPKSGGSTQGSSSTPATHTTTEAPTDDKQIDDIKARLKKQRGKKVDEEQDEEEKPKSGIKK